MVTDACLICKLNPIKTNLEFSRRVYHVECARCGDYIISEYFFIFSDVRERLEKISHILSGLSRELKETGGKRPEFLSDNIEKLASSYPVPDLSSIENKTEKLLNRLKEKTSYYGEVLQIRINMDYPLAYAKNRKEFLALLNLLKEKKLISVKSQIVDDSVTSLEVVLLASGWDLVYKFKNKNLESKQVFIGVWFAEQMSEYIQAIEEAIKHVGLTPLCIKDKYYSETIRDKALGEIRKSRFVVVDLTGDRPSVFFEAGFAFGLGVDAIYVYKTEPEGVKSNLDFYVKHYQCHGYANKEELKEIITNALSARIKV